MPWRVKKNVHTIIKTLMCTTFCVYVGWTEWAHFRNQNHFSYPRCCQRFSIYIYGDYRFVVSNKRCSFFFLQIRLNEAHWLCFMPCYWIQSNHNPPDVINATFLSYLLLVFCHSPNESNKVSNLGHFYDDKLNDATQDDYFLSSLPCYQCTPCTYSHLTKWPFERTLKNSTLIGISWKL